MQKQNLIKVSLISSAVILRLIPHLPNFTPIGALGIFGGSCLGKRSSILMVALSMLISDYLLLYINPYSPQPFNFSHIYSPLAIFHLTTVFIYSSLIINVFIGWGIGQNRSAKNIIAGALLSSVQFFLITNFGVWATGYYPQNLSGLAQSYIMGLPFFKWTLLGDLFYTTLFFGSYELSQRLLAQKAKISV